MITQTMLRRVLAKLEAETQRAYDAAVQRYHDAGDHEESRKARENAETFKTQRFVIHLLQGDDALVARLAKALNFETRGVEA